MLDTVTDRYLLPLLQLCDSNFPTGAFSHSFGLETYIQEDKVYNKRTFAEWLTIYINEQLIYNDGLVLRLTYEALQQMQMEKLWSYDRMMTVQSLARETREGVSRIGQRMISLGTELYDSTILADYQKRIKQKKSYGHPAIAFAIIAHHLQIPKSTALLAYLFSCVASLIQNGVRGIPLGQTEGQHLYLEVQDEIYGALDRIAQLGEEDLGISSPGIELSQMNHERLHIRLFMS